MEDLLVLIAWKLNHKLNRPLRNIQGDSKGVHETSCSESEH